MILERDPSTKVYSSRCHWTGSLEAKRAEPSQQGMRPIQRDGGQRLDGFSGDIFFGT